MSYVILNKQIRPIEYEDYAVLFDNRTAEEYLLEDEQISLIKSLDGTKTKREIVDEYEEHCRNNVSSYIDDMCEKGLVNKSKSPFNQRKFHDAIKPYLEGVLFDVTSNCNLQCSHCYVSNFYKEGKGSDLSMRNIDNVLDDLKEMNVRDIAVTGGEPILRGDIYDIISGIVDRDIRLGSFFTNGIAVNEKFVSFLEGLPQFTRVYVSLDGSTPTAHSKIRGTTHESTKYFNMTIRAIEMFVEAGIPVTINTCLHNDSLSEIISIYNLLKQLGVDQWRMAVPKPIGRYESSQGYLKPDWDLVLASYKKLLYIHLNEVSIDPNGVISPLEIELEMLFRTEMLNKTIKLYQPSDLACFYHRNRCSIKANGDVITCGYFDYNVAGNIKEQSIRDIWLGERMQNIKHMLIDEVTGCKDCEVLNLCGTGCRAIAHRLTGNMFEKDDYACAQVIKFQKEILPKLIENFGFKLDVTKDSRYYSN